MFTTASASASTSRKLLVPLATLVAAGAVAVGSGATWTSSTDTSLSVTAGNILHANDHGGATLSITKLTPGDVEVGTLQIRNDGDVPIDLAVSQEASPTNAFSDVPVLDVNGDPVVVGGVPVVESALQLTIAVNGDTKYDGDFDQVTTGTALFADIPASTPADDDDIVTVTFTVSLAAASPNVDQGKLASNEFTFVTTENADTGESAWSNVTGWVPGV